MALKIMSLTEAAAGACPRNHGRRRNAGDRRPRRRQNAGCAGMAYTLDYVSEAPAGDDHVSEHGVDVWVEPKATLFLLGTVMDFKVDRMSSGFTFTNPNEISACGCGESVQLEQARPPGLGRSPRRRLGRSRLSQQLERTGQRAHPARRTGEAEAVDFLGVEALLRENLPVLIEIVQCPRKGRKWHHGSPFGNGQRTTHGDGNDVRRSLQHRHRPVRAGVEDLAVAVGELAVAQRRQLGAKPDGDSADGIGDQPGGSSGLTMMAMRMS